MVALLYHMEDRNSEDTDEAATIDALSRKLTKENIEEYATLEESTVQTLTPDKDGYISWSWELEDGSVGDGPLFVDETYETSHTNNVSSVICVGSLGRIL